MARDSFGIRQRQMNDPKPVSSLLRSIYNLPGSNGIAHFGKCRGVVGEIGVEYGQIGRPTVFDSAAPAIKATGGVGGERGEDLAIVHSSARHEREFERCVVAIRVADIGTEQDVAASLPIGAQLGNHLRDPAFAFFLTGIARFKIEQGQRRNQGEMRPFESRAELWNPRWRLRNRVREHVYSAVDGNVDSC